MKGEVFACARCGEGFTTPLTWALHTWTTHLHADVGLHPANSKALLKDTKEVAKA